MPRKKTGPQHPSDPWRKDESQHPGGFRMWRAYPQGVESLAGIYYGTHPQSKHETPYKADVLIVPDDDCFRLIYKGEPPGLEDPYLIDFWAAVAEESEIIPPDAPTIIWWPEGIDRFLSRDHFVYEYTRRTDRDPWSLDLRDPDLEAALSHEYNLEFDLERSIVSGPFEEVRRHGWRHNDTTKWIMEIAIGFGSGLSASATYDLLRAALRRIANRLRERDHPLEEWRNDEGYL